MGHQARKSARLSQIAKTFGGGAAFSPRAMALARWDRETVSHPGQNGRPPGRVTIQYDALGNPIGATASSD